MILSLPRIQVFDVNGDPASGARLYAYYAGSPGSPKDTYTDYTLGTANANPVVADSTGLFPAIYLSGDYLLSMQTSTGQTLWTQDHINPPASIDLTYLANSTLAALTYATVDVADTLLIYDASANVWKKIAVPDLNVRPLVVGSSHTLALSEANSTQYNATASTYSVTVPPNSSTAFPVGTILRFLNTSTGAQTLVAGSGVTITARGLTVLGNKGLGTLIKVATDTWSLTGNLDDGSGIKVMTADVSNATTTITTATGLSGWNLQAATWYAVDAAIFHNGNATGDLKIAFTFDQTPQVATAMVDGVDSSAFTSLYVTDLTTAAAIAVGNTSSWVKKIRGKILTHATVAGAVAFQFALNSATGSVTMEKGSWVNLTAIGTMPV